MAAPLVVLVGRVNVGKSSLFNRCIEEDRAIVSNVAGTTRDWKAADCVWRGAAIRLVDTGGIDVDVRDVFHKEVVEQTRKAIARADLAVLVLDATVGPTADDLAIAQELMKKKIPVVAVANKVETPAVRARVQEDWGRFPFSQPFPVSAKQGTGVGDALDAIVDALIAAGHTPEPIDPNPASPIRVAVLGQPNVGKSTLLNAIIGEERFIASGTAHTTREPNDILVEDNGQSFLFIDTAGIRTQASRRRSNDDIEQTGVAASLDTIQRADVALLVLDITRAGGAQDRHLAGLLANHRASVIIIVNKWDLIPDKTPTTINDAEKKVRALFPQLNYAPILFTSALFGQRANDVLELVRDVWNQRFIKLDDEQARTFLARAIMRHKPQRGSGVKHPKITQFVQTGVNPPLFLLHVNLPREDALNVAYLRFLEHQLREQWGFSGAPIRIRVIPSSPKTT